MTFNILVVDDSLPMRKVIKKTIKASGFTNAEYSEASDGIEALKVLGEKWFDIVVTDYNMPNMDGMALIEEMKKDETLSTIPVLVITTEGSRARVEEFALKGAAGYIKKPFTPEAIRTKLREILGETNENNGFETENDDFDF